MLALSILFASLFPAPATYPGSSLARYLFYCFASPIPYLSRSPRQRLCQVSIALFLSFFTDIASSGMHCFLISLFWSFLSVFFLLAASFFSCMLTVHMAFLLNFLFARSVPFCCNRLLFLLNWCSLLITGALQPAGYCCFSLFVSMACIFIASLNMNIGF